jgi:hypothetical protein
LKAAMNMHLDEYNESESKDALHLAMDIYVREYMPEIHNLRMLRYSVMEMEVPPGGDPKNKIRALNQSAASLRQLETLHGEVPRVLSFSTGLTGKNTQKEPEALVLDDEEEEEEEQEGGVIPWTREEE